MLHLIPSPANRERGKEKKERDVGSRREHKGSKRSKRSQGSQGSQGSKKRERK
jgi:hypothetical protein